MTSIGIIGSGFGALSVAIEIAKAGHTDIRLWERADDLGGVWRDNTYPGAGCDVPSPLYSFSFEPNPNWSRRYALRDEIHAYIKSVADKYAITPRVQLGHTVVAARFDESAGDWTVTFESGEEQRVDVLVSAVGQLSRPRTPTITGAESFEGSVFHSAEWDHSVEMSGKRVCVIGAGASAIQFVPHLARSVAKLSLFARSANYILPKPDNPYWSVQRSMYRHLPFTQRLERDGIWAIMEQFARGLDDESRIGQVNKSIAMLHLKRQVKDPVLRAKLTPDYPVGCKRILFSNNYYPALARPNVDVVTAGVESITPTGVRDSSGVDHPADVIIYATGFDAQDFLASIDITGRDGLKLADQWSDGAHAYIGMYAPNFPNLFLSYGPNTNLGGGSIIYMLEAQARHMRKVLDRMVSGGYRTVEVTAEAERAYDDDLQHLLEHSAWAHCDSWYRHKSGRITSNWPGATLPFAKRTKNVDTEAFAWA